LGKLKTQAARLKTEYPDAVEREKTLRGAARTLNLDQATVGRRIAALEHALRATLFLRTSEGYALTAAGEAALRFECAEQSR
jgi:DNA-binding transcriptional LysR family regulator